MLIAEISFKRIRNLGNYENAEVMMKGIPEDGEDSQECLQKLKDLVNEGLGFKVKKEVPTDEITSVEEGGNVRTTDGKLKDPSTGEEIPEEKTEKKKTPTKKAPAKKTPKKQVEEAQAEEVVEEEVTLAALKDVLKQVCKVKGLNIALEILKKYGVEKSDELDASDYSKVMKDVKKCLA